MTAEQYEAWKAEVREAKPTPEQGYALYGLGVRAQRLGTGSVELRVMVLGPITSYDLTVQPIKYVPAAYRSGAGRQLIALSTLGGGEPRFYILLGEETLFTGVSSIAGEEARITAAAGMEVDAVRITMSSDDDVALSSILSLEAEPSFAVVLQVSSICRARMPPRLVDLLP